MESFPLVPHCGSFTAWYHSLQSFLTPNKAAPFHKYSKSVLPNKKLSLLKDTVSVCCRAFTYMYMYRYMYIYTHTYTSVCVYIHTHTYIHIHIFTYTYIYTHTYTYIYFKKTTKTKPRFLEPILLILYCHTTMYTIWPRLQMCFFLFFSLFSQMQVPCKKKIN